MSYRTALGLLLLLALSGTLSAQPEKNVPEEKPTPGRFSVKGTLTALQTEAVHLVPLRKDQAYTVELSSPGFFTSARIEGDLGKVAEVGTGHNNFKPTMAGTYRFAISSPGGNSGHYTLTVSVMNLTKVNPGEILTVGRGGLNIDALLVKDDPLDKVRKKRCKIYEVNMTSGKKYVIDMISKQFDAFLRLEDADGKQLAQDDDSGGDNNARINFRCKADGVYRIIATGFGNDTGMFLLKVREE